MAECANDGPRRERGLLTVVDEARFLASFPQIMSAIRLVPDGMRIQIEIPESELDNAAPILAWRAEVLEITVRRTVQSMEQHGRTQMAKRGVPKSQWAPSQEPSPDDNP